MKVLVTGVVGLLLPTLWMPISIRGIEVIIVDNLSTGNIEKQECKSKILQGRYM